MVIHEQGRGAGAAVLCVRVKCRWHRPIVISVDPICLRGVVINDERRCCRPRGSGRKVAKFNLLICIIKLTRIAMVSWHWFCNDPKINDKRLKEAEYWADKTCMN